MLPTSANTVLELFRVHAAHVRAHCLQLLRDDEDAADALQDVFLSAWLKWEGFDDGRGSELTWLLAIARGKCLDRLRRRALLARTASSFAREIDDTDHGRTEVTASAPLARALAALPAAQRRMVMQAYVEGMTRREIAFETGLPIGTVKTRLRMGLARLAAMLREGLHGPAASSMTARARCNARGDEAADARDPAP